VTHINADNQQGSPLIKYVLIMTPQRPHAELLDRKISKMMIWSSLIGDYKLKNLTREVKFFRIQKMKKDSKSKGNSQAKDLRGIKLIEYKKTLKLNTIQKEILVGTLLGDATLSKSKSIALNVKFEQKLANKEYVNHLYEIFEPYVGTPPRVRNITGGGAKDRHSIWFRTYRHIDFKFYYDLFYRKTNNNNSTDLRKKRVPKLIHKFLTPRALAYWYMDDGSCYYKKSKNSQQKVHNFNTQSFSYEDIKILKEALKLNFNFDTNIYRDRDYYLLYIQPQSTDGFTKLIKPFLLEIFDSKL